MYMRFSGGQFCGRWWEKALGFGFSKVDTESSLVLQYKLGFVMLHAVDYCGKHSNPFSLELLKTTRHELPMMPPILMFVS